MGGFVCLNERTGMSLRLLVAGGLVVLAAIGWWSIGDAAFDLAALRQLRAELAGQVQAEPLLAALLFICSYLLVAALALPGALLLTLLGGALFGFGWGLVLVSLASSLGALLAFVVVRLIAGRGLRERLAARLAVVARGIERDGAYYVFTLRVVPVFPFFVVNVLLGLTPIRAWTFYWVSVIGMMPATLVYVNAGSQLASLESLSGLLSPALMGSLALLGVLPLLARGALAAVAQRVRIAAALRDSRRRWAAVRPARFDRDLVVIGAGAAGLVAANVAATLRARVTLIEREAMGGDCLNTGCVPSKALIHLADRIHAARSASRWMAIASEASVDRTSDGDRFAAIMAQVRATIARIAPHDSVERYQSLGVECIRGNARALSPWTVEVTTEGDAQPRRIDARHLIIATGAEPVIPQIPGLMPERVLTTSSLWAIDALPSRLLVLGGGPVGCELAQALQRLGSQVTLIERAARLLPREEPEASAEVLKALSESGVRILLGAELTEVCTTKLSDATAMIRAGGQQVEQVFDKVLCALGRRARVEGAGLEALGLARDAEGMLQVDDWMRTSEPGVYACGDVATADRLTHVAGQMGWHAAVNALFGVLWPLRIDRSATPRCIFTDPEVARVGMTQSDAARDGRPIEVTRFELASLDRAIIEQQTRGFVMVLTARGTDRIVGATVVGARAGDLIALFTLAMRERIGMRRLMSMTIAYPGWGDAVRAGAAQWQRERSPEFVFRWLERWHRWRRG